MSDSIEWFRHLLEKSRESEEKDCGVLIEWLESRRAAVKFSAELIGLNDVEGWSREGETGNIVHRSGGFFSIEGVRIRSYRLREVNSWDQPIYNQKEGGILALICRRVGGTIAFLLQAKAEPGNIGTLQFSPTIQATWSNLNRDHKGNLPPFAGVLMGEIPSRVVYKARHNEEGGRFWRKSNSNEIYLLEDPDPQFGQNLENFVWASLSQIKALALLDDVLSPFVKTIIAPL